MMWWFIAILSAVVVTVFGLTGVAAIKAAIAVFALPVVILYIAVLFMD